MIIDTQGQIQRETASNRKGSQLHPKMAERRRNSTSFMCDNTEKEPKEGLELHSSLMKSASYKDVNAKLTEHCNEVGKGKGEVYVEGDDNVLEEEDEIDDEKDEIDEEDEDDEDDEDGEPMVIAQTRVNIKYTTEYKIQRKKKRRKSSKKSKAIFHKSLEREFLENAKACEKGHIAFKTYKTMASPLEFMPNFNYASYDNNEQTPPRTCQVEEKKLGKGGFPTEAIKNIENSSNKDLVHSSLDKFSKRKENDSFYLEKRSVSTNNSPELSKKRNKPRDAKIKSIGSEEAFFQGSKKIDDENELIKSLSPPKDKSMRVSYPTTRATKIKGLVKINTENIFFPSGAHISSQDEDSSKKSPRKLITRWTKLSSMWKALHHIMRNQVNHIDVKDLEREMNTPTQSPSKNRSPERSHFSEVLDLHRRIKLFSICCERGSDRDIAFMKELLTKDPKKFLRGKLDPEHLLNKKNLEGQTPLYIAAKHGNEKVVDFLLENQANPLIPSSIDKMTIESTLEVAVRWGHFSISRKLLNHSRFPKFDIKRSILQTHNIEMKEVLKIFLKKHYPKKFSLCPCF